MVAGIIMLVLFAAVIVGYVMNIFKIFSAMGSPITGLFIVRIIGIFIPVLGGIIGYIKN